MLTRRTLVAAAAAGLLAGPAAKAAPQALKVYKTATCGCCKGWITHMRRAGFRPEVVILEDITPLNARYKVPFELSSCHLATVGGYVAVGHIPPADIHRLLKERPKALGLTVAGMPIGSPGMEARDGRAESYDTLLLLGGGRTAVFARHPAA
jgi:hypothetical protein